jgi:hypothetical protein
MIEVRSRSDPPASLFIRFASPRCLTWGTPGYRARRRGSAWLGALHFCKGDFSRHTYMIHPWGIPRTPREPGPGGFSVTQRSDSRARSWRQADVVTNCDRLGGAECRSSDATIGQEETWNPCPYATAKRSFGDPRRSDHGSRWPGHLGYHSWTDSRGCAGPSRLRRRMGGNLEILGRPEHPVLW